MTVSAVLNPNVATIEAREGVVEAANRMRAEHVGDLVVIEYRDGYAVPVGIITDRDIVVGVVARRVTPDDVTVGDAMTRKPLTVPADASLEFALREMRRRGVRRAPVVGAGGELVGILTMDDVIAHLAHQFGRIADVIRLEQDAEVGARP